MFHSIPSREPSAHCGQHARTTDPERLLEILDSEQIARTSKNQDTAESSFALAVECNHALAELGASSHMRGRMAALECEFPALAALVKGTEGSAPGAKTQVNWS